MNKAKEILGKTNFKMTRLDILYEENKRVLRQRFVNFFIIYLIFCFSLRFTTKIDHRFKKKFSIFEKNDEREKEKNYI